MSSLNEILNPKGSPYLFPNAHGSLPELVEKYCPLPYCTKQASVALKGTEGNGFSAIYRNANLPEALKEAVAPGLETYHAIFNYSVSSYKDSPCLAYREYNYETQESAPEYTSMSYYEVDKIKRDYGSGLLHLLQHNPYKNSDKFESHRKIDNHLRDHRLYNKDNMSFILTLYSGNRREWVITDIMCSAYSITDTALYDTLGANTSEYILETTESPVVVASRDHIEDLIRLKELAGGKLDHLISIISMDPLDFQNKTSLSDRDKELLEKCKRQNIQLVDIFQVAKVGEAFPLVELPPTPDAIYTISFTSGTTGSKPKGVLLSQRNIAASMAFTLSHIDFIRGGRSFCFLPLAHIFERETSAFVICSGQVCGFPRLGGTPLTLIEDLKLFKPSVMTNVPRILTKFESVIKNATIEHPTSSFKRSLFNYVFNVKQAKQASNELDNGPHLVYDNLLLQSIRKQFGYDNLKLTITGSAPISPTTIKFLKSSLNIGLLQGYGLTESFAGVAISNPHEAEPGSCGPVGVTAEMRLKELPEMGYKLDDPTGPKGELLLRGPQTFLGYFKNPEETAKAMDKDGWFYTGDVARISKSGELYIIDRVKNFFKLAQGEYVTPEKVESKYLSDSAVLSQLFVHGDSLKSFLVGIAGVEPDAAKQFLVDKCKVSTSELNSPEEILTQINKKENRAILVNYLNQKTKGLQGFEKVRNLYFEYEPLRLDRAVVTPTAKIRRPLAAKFFAEQIKSMYDEGSLITSTKL